MRRPAVLGLVLLAILVAVGVMFVRARSGEDGPSAGAPPSLGPTLPRRGTHERAPRVRAPAEDGVPAAADAPAMRTIRGTVHDSDGRPIGGATVTVCPLDPTGRVFDGSALVDFAHPLASARSAIEGDVGKFELTFAASSDLVVVGSRDGFAPSSTRVTEGDVVNLELQSGADREFVVVDIAGSPVAGAELWRVGSAQDTSLVSWLAVADSEGRARLAIAGDRFEEVVVHAPGFADEWPRTPDEDAAREAIRVVLHEGRNLAGVVVDDRGTPMAGVLVTAEQSARRTGTDGTFRFDGLDAEVQDATGGLSLTAKLDGWCGGEHIDVFPGDLGIRVVLRRTATVRGVVVHEDGSPASGARVRGEVNTDSEGRFELVNFASGHEIVWADAGSPLDARIPVHGSEYADAPPGGTVEDLRIVLAPDAWTSYVEVRVIDPDGRPVAKADVVAWDDQVKVADNATEDDGARLLRIRGRAGARVRIAASTRASTGGPPVLDAVSDGLVETRLLPPFETVRLQLGPPGRLRLRAVDPAGQDVPIDPAQVEAGRDDVCGPDGMWTLSATRSFWATVHVPGFAVRTVDLRPPHPRLREEMVRLVPAAGVTGRVLGSDGRAAVGEPTVMVVVHDTTVGTWEREESKLPTDGKFVLSSLPAGPANLYILDDDETVLAFRTFDVVAGKPTDLGDIRLAGPTAFRGVVIDEKGKGIGGAVVAFSDPSGDSVHFPVATRPDGTFDVTVPGSYPLRVLVTRPGRATQFVATTPAMPLPVRVVLGPPGRLRVVEDFDHGPGGRDRAAVRPPGTDWEWTPPDALDPADPEGDLDGDVYGDLPPGPIEVVVRVEGQPDRVRRVEIVAGKTVECIFDK